MNNLKKIVAILKAKKAENEVFNYTIPDLWNVFGYDGEELINTPNGEVMVNPYKFYSSLIVDYILSKRVGQKNYNRPLSKIKGVTKASIKSEDTYKGGDWIKKSTIYSSMIRSSSSWDHDRSGTLEEENIYRLKETGTFLKTLALLPLLKKMGVTALYLLPISQFSLKDKKGELGSPYGVSNFFKLSESLKDPILGNEMSVEEEFQALVEACHILDIRVIVDIIPRTNSVNSDLIASNPDWFYWIKNKDLKDYYPPQVAGVGRVEAPKEEYLESIYSSENVTKHISKFIINPKETMPEEWDKVIRKWNASNQVLNIIDLVRSELDVTVAPAFSDHINDNQPPWSDITFFRMFLDHPSNSQKYLSGNEAPYILFDTIKSSWHEGNKPNMELWDTLSNILPRYQKTFGIDGARIDMGHALPKELVKMIVSNIRKIDPDFSFIAEELDHNNADSAFESGYNMIIGKGFYSQPRIWSHESHAFYYSVNELKCPVFAGGETHDTPRLAAREQGGKYLSKMITALNMVTPNGVPFINSGQEVYETQPMNTGIDCRENEMFMLAPEDQFNGKLALFDKYAFHYLNKDRWELPNMLEELSNIRNEYLDILTDKDKFVGLGFSSPGENAIGLGYYSKEAVNSNALLVIANTDVYNSREVFVDISALRNKSKNSLVKGLQIFSTHENEKEICNFDQYHNLNIFMNAGEVKIIKL